MFDLGHPATLKRELDRTLAAFGMSARLVRAGTDEATACECGLPVRFLLRHPGVKDEAIVNAYGVGAAIVTLAHRAEYESAPLVKFDALHLPDGSRLVFDSVVRRAVADTVVAWTAFCRGAGVA